MRASFQSVEVLSVSLWRLSRRCSRRRGIRGTPWWKELTNAVVLIRFWDECSRVEIAGDQNDSSLTIKCSSDEEFEVTETPSNVVLMMELQYIIYSQ